MDFWVFVVTAGAGCLTKWLKSSIIPRGFKVCNDTLNRSWSIGDLPQTKGMKGNNPTGKVVSPLEDCNFLSIAYLSTDYTANIEDIARVNTRISDRDRDICSILGDDAVIEIDGSIQRSLRKLKPKPSTSLESCLEVQLHNHNSDQEDGMRSSSMERSLPIGRRSNREVNGAPSLPSLPTHITSDARSAISISSVGRKNFYGQHGSMHESILYSLGVWFGVMSSAATKNTDMDNLKESLKHSESLVQDLQEELEMKESITVKELGNEMHVSRDTDQTLFPDADPTSSLNERHEGGMGENPSSMRKIEAELEDELERLGLNVGLCNVQLNDMMVDIPKGRDLENDGSSHGSTSPSVNCAVSPRELTLRLHEVIQSRLEERIQELELALENSQRKVLLMESAQKLRTRRQFFNDVARPVVMNLLGEALSAYDEAYGEILKFDSSEESTPSFRDYSPSHRSVMQNSTIDKIGFMNGAEPPFLHGAEAGNGSLSYDQDTDSLSMSRDESSDADEEMLIRQLVERTKRGSPAERKVQRPLFSDRGDRH